MAWGPITTPSDYTVGDPFPAADANDYVLDMIAQLWANDQVMGGNGATAPTGALTDHETRLLAVEAITVGTIVSKTANYTILDNDGHGTILCDPRTGAFTCLLPTAAANTNRILRFIVSYAGGAVTIDGEGSEKIQAGTNSLDSIVLQSQGDKLMIICNGTGWYALDLCATLDTGWQNRSDWTNVHLGNSQCPYDGLSGTFTVGEVITEATSGNTGIIMSDTGSNLILKNVTGTGIWTNDRVITGAHSGATANVNVATSTKDKDYDIYHNFGVSLVNLIIEKYFSTGASEDTIFEANWDINYGTTAGMGYIGLDTNSLRMQTSSSTPPYLKEDGTLASMADHYARVIIRWII
jgi:hypothetical protein